MTIGSALIDYVIGKVLTGVMGCLNVLPHCPVDPKSGIGPAESTAEEDHFVSPIHDSSYRGAAGGRFPRVEFRPRTTASHVQPQGSGVKK
ncbi:hypothetical protein [Actinacidiphila acididurans]|uniref:Uncharacterized protein n=1 Tax=Actinacidiphila acididurans TaxID=2784346 RepID=A0ABS2U5X6_9ACTN|nr:hypothetical protein [Actinacidiphila acididurans]MBM9509558.1 hypothetical protein [Actinacidiphila acididurans]